ncbi:DUF1499 domain-containing protein [Candidatus Gracilibacteria bacterium]|nr:DUF1499 domain-containing protein [Candidatus Gracilibacteria bacterium]NJM89853.1 DUF1499 domain-containing protein [Hydrococcus sp. RU_2_2]NJP21792.1 DUF1499 domain-containing protein [Hydrococcus sp. CRU_1_1]
MSAAKENTKSINLSLLTVVLLLLVVVIWVGIRLVFPDSSTILAGMRPENLGIREGKLLSCPTTPNCVSSQSTDAEHTIEPLTYQSSTTEAIANLKSIIQSQERAKIIAETDNYLYAEFASHWMGFVDDVEFYANEATEKIDVRSASRLGESDLGVNRQRVESIRNQLKSF